jgi:ABC-type sugar transport system substrate-binding protein
MPRDTSRVAVVLHVLEDSWWSESVRREIESAFKTQPHVQVEFADPQGDPSEQIRLLDRYLDEKIDALVLLPIDPELTRAALLKYRESGIPVVLVDNDIGAPALYRTLIANDNGRIGRDAGGFFVEVTGGVGNLVEVRGMVKTAAAVDRSAGLRAALAGHPELRLVDSCVGDWRYEQALREFGGILARQPRIDGVFAQNDDMARGVLDAAQRAGRGEEMLVVGVDAVPSAIHLVTAGRQAVTFFNPSPGKHAAHAVLALLKGEPCLPRITLHTWPYRSNGRIQEWQKRRLPQGGARGAA